MPSGRKLRKDVIVKLPTRTLRRALGIPTMVHAPTTWIREGQRIWLRMGKAERTYRSFETPRQAGEYVRKILLEKGVTLTKPTWVQQNKPPGFEIGEFSGKDNYIRIFWGNVKKQPVVTTTHEDAGIEAGAAFIDIEISAFQFGLGV
jgi:hypothetical protein